MDPLTTQMASPPTVTVGAANAPATIAGGTMVYAGNTGDTIYTYFGTTATKGPSFPKDSFLSPSNAADAGTIWGRYRFAVEVDYDGAELELWTYAAGGGYRLTVQGEGYASRTGPAPLPSDGQLYHIHYDFGTAAPRRLRWDMTGTFFWGGIVREGGATLSKVDTAWTEKVAILGDSFTEGTGADRFGLTGYPDHLGMYLGWPDLIPAGVGGTGYLNANGSLVTATFRDRAQKDIIDQLAGFAGDTTVIVAGGINDHASFTPAAIQTEAETLFDAILAGLPGVRLIVVGPWWPTGSPPETLIQTRDAIRAAATGRAETYVETIGGPYPYSGNPADYQDTGLITSANAGTYISADGTHPSQAGHDYLALELATAIDAPAVVPIAPTLFFTGHAPADTFRAGREL